jgi:hypothetical protein
VNAAASESAAAKNEEEEGEPDLFDYFDPLLSPHAYPNGIGKKPDVPVSTNKNKTPSKMNVFGIDYYSQRETKETETQTATATENDATEEKLDTTGNDLFEYFDPLLSPHAYPNGINPNTKPKALEVVEQTDDDDDRYDPLTFPKFAENKKQAESSGSSSSSSGSSGKIGILLMDHGSRNEASNARLQSMAELYQMTMADENVLVRAAHMEIASPSIPEALEQMLQEGVGTYPR